MVAQRISAEIPVNSGDTESTMHIKPNKRRNKQELDALNLTKLRKNSTDAVLSLLNSPERTKDNSPVSTEDELENILKHEPRLSIKSRTILQTMDEQMNEPTNSMSDLIAAIEKPENGEYTRGIMVRRKNACVAMQSVMTKRQSDRIQVCWTKGVLPALRSVLEDGLCESLEERFPDEQILCEYIETRKRAVATLVTMAIPQENRLILYHCPQLVEVVVKTIDQVDNECRKGCVAILAYLCKLKDNRLLMTRIPGIFDAVVEIIDPEDCRSDQEDIADCRTDGSSFKVSSRDTEDSLESMFGENEDQRDVSQSTISIRAGEKYECVDDQHLRGARQNVFALLLHLVREKDNTYLMARQVKLTKVLSEIAELMDCASQEYACKIIANLTRHHGNTKYLVLEDQKIVPALLKASYSKNDETRKYICFALQNLCHDSCCRRELADTEDFLHTLCVRIRQAYNHDERLAAIYALKNLTEEPGTLIAMSSTPECFPTLMQIADARDDNVTEMMRYIGCDALANLSHWFRILATKAKNFDDEKLGTTICNDLLVPSLNQIAWEQWK